MCNLCLSVQIKSIRNLCWCGCMCLAVPADLPAPVRDVGCSRKCLYFLRPSGWCHTASGRLIPQPFETQGHLQERWMWDSPLIYSRCECTLQWRWCAVWPSVLPVQTVEVRLTSSSSGTSWLLKEGSCMSLLSAGARKFSSAAEKKLNNKTVTCRRGWYIPHCLTFPYSNSYFLHYTSGTRRFDTCNLNWRFCMFCI